MTVLTPSLVLGMLLIAFGATLLFATRRHVGDKWLIYGLAVPALGCGGWLVIFPLMSFVLVLLMFVGIGELCKNSAC